MFDRTKIKLEAWLISSLDHIKEVRTTLIDEVKTLLKEAREDYEKRKQRQKMDQNVKE